MQHVVHLPDHDYWSTINMAPDVVKTWLGPLQSSGIFLLFCMAIMKYNMDHVLIYRECYYIMLFLSDTKALRPRYAEVKTQTQFQFRLSEWDKPVNTELFLTVHKSMSHLEENQLVTPQRTDSTRKRDREDDSPTTSPSVLPSTSKSVKMSEEALAFVNNLVAALQDPHVTAALGTILDDTL